MIKKFFTTIGMTLLFPVSAFAQRLDAKNATTLIKTSRSFINQLIPVLISLAVVYIIFSTILFIGETDDSQKKDERKQQIFWGIIGLFVIISVWGLVAFVGRTFGIFAGGALNVQ